MYNIYFMNNEVIFKQMEPFITPFQRTPNPKRGEYFLNNRFPHSWHVYSQI